MDLEKLSAVITSVVRNEVAAAFAEHEVRKARGMASVVIGADCRADREQTIALVADALQTPKGLLGSMKAVEARIAQGAVDSIFKEVFSVEITEDQPEASDGEWKINVGRVKRRTDAEILDCAARAVSLCRQALQP